ncbi:MAG: 6,7-dimethyl-8-ribityllumazine synthase [Acidimicrobiales bacterium]
MTSSEGTRLSQAAKERIAFRVGTVLDAARAREGDGEGDRRHRRAGLRVAFACAEFNGGITERLLEGALDALEEAGGDPKAATVAWAPGAFELPLVAQRLATSGSFDAVVCLGAVIRGETGHYDFVAGQCAAGIQRVQLDTGVPVAFGVLTTDTVEQALARSGADDENKGREALGTVLDTATVLAAVPNESAASVGFAGGRR